MSGRGRFPRKVSPPQASTTAPQHHTCTTQGAGRGRGDGRGESSVDEPLPDASQISGSGTRMHWGSAHLGLRMQLLHLLLQCESGGSGAAEHWQQHCKVQTPRSTAQTQTGRRKHRSTFRERQYREAGTSCTNLLCRGRRYCWVADSQRVAQLSAAVACWNWAAVGRFPAQHHCLQAKSNQATFTERAWQGRGFGLAWACWENDAECQRGARDREGLAGWGPDGRDLQGGEISISNPKTRFNASPTHASLRLLLSRLSLILTPPYLQVASSLLPPRRIRPKTLLVANAPPSARFLGIIWSYRWPRAGLCWPVLLGQWIGRLLLRFVRLHRPFSSQRIIRRDLSRPSLGPRS